MSATPSKEASKGKFAPNLFSVLSNQKVQADLTKQVSDRDKYIAILEQLLRENGIEIPEGLIDRDLHAKKLVNIVNNLLQQGTAEEIQSLIDSQKPYLRDNDFPVEFYDLTMSTEIPVEREIFSVSTIFSNLFLLLEGIQQA
mmetsp:Transcript_4531/g.4964  ORF Transcript_4531/g.4964 Transcript_4531/m.4964 type:complete len:142 (-) Transcript_4531:46-471(-)